MFAVICEIDVLSKVELNIIIILLAGHPASLGFPSYLPSDYMASLRIFGV